MKYSVQWLFLLCCVVMPLIMAEPNDWQLHLRNTFTDFPVISGLERAEYRQLSPVIGAMSWSTNRMDRWMKRNPLLKVSLKTVGDEELEVMNPQEQLQPVDTLLTTLFRVINGRANGSVEPKRLSDNVPFVLYQKELYGTFLKAVIDSNTTELNKIFSLIQKPKKILKRHEYDAFIALVQKALKVTIGDDTVYSPEAAQMFLSTFFIANLLIDAETQEQFDAAIQSYMQAFGASYSKGIYKPEELSSKQDNGTIKVTSPSYPIDYDYNNPEVVQKLTSERQEILYLALVDAMVRTGMRPLIPSMLHYININLHKIFEPAPITIASDSAQKYANCVEVALLNFFNILFFNPDTQKIDLSLIPENAELLRNFYSNFSLVNKADYKKMIEAWTKLFVVPVPTAPSAVLSYARKVASGQPFELDGDFGNFLHAIEYLLGMPLSEVFVGKIDKDTSKDLEPILQRDLKRFNAVMTGLVESLNAVTARQGYLLSYKGDDEVDLETGLVSFTLTRKNITTEEEAIIEFDLHYNHSEANTIRAGVLLDFFGSSNGAFTDGWINKFGKSTIWNTKEQDPQDIREIQRYIENHKAYSVSYSGRADAIFKNIFLNTYIPESFKPLIIDYILDILIEELDEGVQIKILNQALFFIDPSSEFYSQILAERKEFEPDEQTGLHLNFLTVYAAYVASLTAEPFLNLFEEPLEQARQILANTTVPQHLTDELTQTFQALIGDRSEATIKDLLALLSKNFLADHYEKELESLFHGEYFAGSRYNFEFRILYQALIIVLYEQLIAHMNQRPARTVDILFTKPYFREFISKQYYDAMSSFSKEIKTAFNLYLIRRYNIDISQYVDFSAALIENNEKGIAKSQKVILDIFTLPNTSRSYNGLYNAMVQSIASFDNFVRSPLGLLLNPFYERAKRHVRENISDSSSESSEDDSAPSSSSSSVDIIFLLTFKGLDSFSILCTGYEFIQLSKNLLELFIKTGNLSGIQWLLPKILLLDTLNLSSQDLKRILAPLEQVSCNTMINVLSQTAIGLLNEVGTVEPITPIVELWKNSLRACKEQGIDIVQRLNETLVPAEFDSKQIEEILAMYAL